MRALMTARAISPLNHPNICAVYAVGEPNGTPYLVMESLEGETLAQRLQKGALRMRDALSIAIALADALNVAHSNGIVHRDLNSTNLFLTSRNQAKILDFGLAKRFAAIGDSADPSLADANTLSVVLQLTDPGTVLGTGRERSVIGKDH
jgi:serine/threonine protein kinase